MTWRRSHVWLAVLIAGCTSAPVGIDESWFTCARSSDCVAAITSCCMGVTAVRADSVFAYAEFVCPESCPAECICPCFGLSQQAAACISGMCTLVEPTRAERTCAVDSDCVEVPARCGDCDDGANYCYVHASVALRGDAVASFGHRLCGPMEELCPALPETIPRYYPRPRCVRGQCEMGPP